MDELGKVISAVQKSENTEEDVKNETLHILSDAKKIIESAERLGKGDEVKEKYKNVQEQAKIAVESSQEITMSELDNLKEEFEKSQNKTADFYVENYLQGNNVLILETNKDIVLKTLKKLIEHKKINKENIKSAEDWTIDLNKINQNLRKDLDIIKSARLEGMYLFPKDIMAIPEDFFNDKDNIKELLKISNDKDLVISLALKQMTEDELIELISEYNDDAEEGKKIEEKYIPLNLLQKDTENDMGIEEVNKKAKIDKVGKMDIYYIDKLIKSAGEGNIVDFAEEIENYLQKYSINNLSDSNLKELLIFLSKEDTLKFAPKLLIGLSSKINVVKDFIEKEDPLFIRYLSSELSKNNEIQEVFINRIISEQDQEHINIFLEYLDLDDTEISIIFYKKVKELPIEKANDILLNPILREKIRRVIGENQNSKIDEKDKKIYEEMIKEFTFFKKGGEDLIKAVQENKNFANINTASEKGENPLNIFAKNIKTKLEINVDDKKLEELIKKIINLKDDDLGKTESIIFFQELLKICGGNKEKTTKFIEEIKNFQISEGNKKQEIIIKSLDLKEENFKKQKLEDIKEDFEKFIQEKINKLKEENKDKDFEINALFYEEAIKEYIEQNKGENLTEEQKSSIKEILKIHTENRKLAQEKENKELYLEVGLGEKKKEEYFKKINDGLKKEYDFKEEKKIVEQYKNNEFGIQNNPENTFIETEKGFNLKTNSGKDIPITKEEKKLIENNEVAKENLIDFKKTLDDLHLSKLWDFRSDIFKVLKGKNTLGFDNEDLDYLNENETKFFLKSILTSLLFNPENEEKEEDDEESDEEEDNIEEQVFLKKSEEQKLSNFKNLNLQATINLVKEINNDGEIIKNEGTSIINPLSRIENIFTNKFSPKNDQFIGFRISDFRKSLDERTF